MPTKSHPVDPFIQYQRKESGDPGLGKSKKDSLQPLLERGVETTEYDSSVAHSTKQLGDRYVKFWTFEAWSRLSLSLLFAVLLHALLTFHPDRVAGIGEQTRTSGLGLAADMRRGVPPPPPPPLLSTNTEDIQSIFKKGREDDGKSVSSNMQDLNIHHGKSAHSNKRAAGEPQAPGEGPRPYKLRPQSTDDNFSRGLSHQPGRNLYHDSAQDQRPDSSQVSVHKSPRNQSPPADLVSARSPQKTTGVNSLENPHSPFQISSGQISTGFSSYPETQKVASRSPPSPAFTSGDRDSSMLLQPETRPITQEQLVNEVKGIYAGLVMVEKKCVEIDQQQGSTTNKLSDEQWQALIALHRTLLHEHHDFFLASQHPSSSPALRRLAVKYAMPARMWRHGIHSFLELLRHRLPDSLDHMLAFVYLAYSMMALLMESVPSFEETWIECLGDLARYRMAIEEADLRDREVWSGVARMWYNKAADKSPNVGRIQHHLAVLARPNIVQQLFYYSKALVSVIPFQNARESIMLLFNPFLEGSEIASQRYPLVESALVKANGILFTHGSVSEYTSLMDQFCSILDNHIGRVTAKFRVQGPEMASSLCAATFDFGNAKAFLFQTFHDQDDWRKAEIEAYQGSHGRETPPPEDGKAKYASMQAYWASIGDTSDSIRANPHHARDSTPGGAVFLDSSDVAAYACQSLGETTTVVSQRIGDKNILPYMHVILAYLFGLAFVPNALIYVEGHVPWENIAIFLNTLGRSGVVEAHFEGADFPQQMSGTGRQLPEDFIMRGLLWAQNYFPVDFFGGQIVDEEERNLELPSHAAPRAERCLWLGVQLASVSHKIVIYHNT
jgi:hypothetical protein